MADQINKKEILDSYILHMEHISFLKGDTNKKDKENIKNYISILKDDTRSIEEHLKTGEELWKLLFRKALSKLTRKSYDNKKIFDYFKAYMDYESLLFGIDEFYRDHTLHLLWVYFVGEYLLKKYIRTEDLQVSLGIYEENINNNKILNITDKKRKDVLEYTNEIWCIISLTHDLAYPVSYIEKINNKINLILPYFGEFKKNGFTLEQSFIQREIIDKMLKIICSDIFYKTCGCNKDCQGHPYQVLRQNLYLLLYNSLEKLEHGVLSSYLIFKNLSYMLGTPFYEPGSNTLHGGIGTTAFLSNQAILKSIAFHTCNIKQFSRFPSFESLLVLSDEIEEFSRWTRATNKRTYIDDLCKVYVEIDIGKISLEYIFEKILTTNLENIPEKFFKYKCRTFLNMFDEDLEKLMNLPNLNNKIPNITIVVKDHIKSPYKQYLFEIKDKRYFILNFPKETDEKIEGKLISEKDNIEKYIQTEKEIEVSKEYIEIYIDKVKENDL